MSNDANAVFSVLNGLFDGINKGLQIRRENKLQEETSKLRTAQLEREVRQGQINEERLQVDRERLELEQDKAGKKQGIDEKEFRLKEEKERNDATNAARTRLDQFTDDALKVTDKINEAETMAQRSTSNPERKKLFTEQANRYRRELDEIKRNQNGASVDVDAPRSISPAQKNLARNIGQAGSMDELKSFLESNSNSLDQMRKKDPAGFAFIQRMVRTRKSQLKDLPEME